MSNRDKVLNMFKKRKSTYNIMMETGLKSSEVYHYIREDEECRARHKAKLYAEKQIKKTW